MRRIIATLAGHILEWYDIAIFATFAPLLAQTFFPRQQQHSAVFTVFATLAASALLKPFGAIMFGHVGDRYGRKNILTLTIIVAAISTFLIGIIPSYQSIGISAALLAISLKCVQALSISGEYQACILFLIEDHDKRHLGLISSMLPMATGIGYLLGSLACSLFTLPGLPSWSWRLAFMIGIIPGCLGLRMRLKLPETETFYQLQQSQQILPHPLRRALSQHKYLLLHASLITGTASAFTNILFIFMPTYLTMTSKLSLHQATLIVTITLLATKLIIPVCGILADRIGLLRLMALSALTLMLASVPLFNVLRQGHFGGCLLAELILASINCGFQAPKPAILARMFPSNVRLTCVGLGMNLGTALIGNTTPLVALYLMQHTNNLVAPGAYLMLCAGAALMVTISYRFSLKNSFDEIENSQLKQSTSDGLSKI